MFLERWKPVMSITQKLRLATLVSRGFWNGVISYTAGSVGSLTNESMTPAYDLFVSDLDN
jgi:hypothetical protein